MSLGKEHAVMPGTGRGKGTNKGILKQGVPLIEQAKYLKQKPNFSLVLTSPLINSGEP